MLEAVIRALVPFVCGGAMSLFGALAGTWRQSQKKERAIELGLQSLLRAEIIRSYEKYIARGACPVYAKEALKREYDSYHQLGGNDVATELYHQLFALPTDADREEDVHG